MTERRREEQQYISSYYFSTFLHVLRFSEYLIVLVAPSSDRYLFHLLLLSTEPTHPFNLSFRQPETLPNRQLRRTEMGFEKRTYAALKEERSKGAKLPEGAKIHRICDFSEIMGDNHFIVYIRDAQFDTIKLPERFTNRIGRLLRSPLLLRTREYTEWGVHFERVDGNILFTMGWREFADRYMIRKHYVVYFQYGGTSLLNVEIYHFSGIENAQPNYPLGMLPTKFFKYIKTTESLRELKLPIPFRKHFQERLENPIFIIPGDGTTWEVYWRIYDGEIQLYRGWKQATTHLSIGIADFCFFRYEGAAKMSITVCKESKGQITPSFYRMIESNNQIIDLVEHTLWTSNVTEYTISGSKPLYIPAAIVKTLFKNRPEKWHFRLPSGDLRSWSFIWTSNRGNEGYLGNGWYSFVEDYPLVVNQKVRFFKEGNDPIVNVEVI